MLRAMWRVLETGLRQLLNGHEDGNVGYSQGVSYGLPRQRPTLPTVISWIAPIGTVAIAVWRPQPSSLFAPSSVKVVARREPTPVMKYVALTKRSPVPFP